MEEMWFSFFDYPQHLSADLGPEFGNKVLENFCTAHGIHLSLGSRECKWEKGLIDRHNRSLGDTIQRLREQFTDTPLPVLVDKAVKARRQLVNHHGWSPMQIVLGQGPSLGSTITPCLQVDANTEQDKILERLQTLREARLAYVQSEASRSVSVGLRSNVRRAPDRYITGDVVYYWSEQKNKRASCWRGPADVIGVVKTTVFIVHGASVIRLNRRWIRSVQDMTDDGDVPPLVVDESGDEDEEDEEMPNAGDGEPRVDDQGCRAVPADSLPVSGPKVDAVVVPHSEGVRGDLSPSSSLPVPVNTDSEKVSPL
jgi:hypothetical protein